MVTTDTVFYINNGVAIAEFNRFREIYQIEDEDLDNEDIFKVVYVGSIRKVNNLGLLLDAAKMIKDPHIKILVWGGGDEMEMLKKRIRDEGIKNVAFKGFVEKKYIPYITTKSNLNLIHNNPSVFFKYGISFNKIFDYLAAGKPILSTFPSKYNPAVMSNAGIQVETPTAENVAKAIESMINSKEHYAENAKKAARNYDFKVLTAQLFDILVDTKRS